ncbi:NAD(P)H dehydrogenase (quinone) [Nakamurella panacisegetis]|uniref:NAD(P)H dehydrogenase (Quinone) n=1 Tax=Nakamurella panacisegetis TaxID=1090615 RepID=A0A1H0IG19_9ACTN|nr:NAD(P)H-binding protein [Nakamurella panacisegetis]SDO30342.1 NAD(P)H dehydrogenase (quinone) [Nakamurella panacisegetis]
MIAITGATGHLGRLVIADLLKAGTPAEQIVAVVRSAGKAEDLAAQGIDVRVADYGQRDALTAALTGVQRLLLISASEPGVRVPQHRNVVEAAVAAGVGYLAYTSLLRADTTQLNLAPEHKATEELIVASGLPYTFLRNGWYLENYTGDLAATIARGTIVGVAGDGRVSAAARADYAAAAAAVLLGSGFEGQILELGGDTSFTLAEQAAAFAAGAGTPVVYQQLTAPAYTEVLTGAGLPAGVAEFVVGIDQAIARGDLETDSHQLSQLIGRPTADPIEFFRAAAAQAVSAG